MPTPKNSEGLLRQVAEHISKMRGGISIGGFAGFNPPDHDPLYQHKIRYQEYDQRDLNDWTKEINRFLKQIRQRHPNLSLEEIWHQHGKSMNESEDLIYHLKITLWESSGYNLQSAESLGKVLEQLKVERLWY